MKKKKKDKNDKPKVNPELEGFDININTFGEIKTNYDIDQLNEFLNRNVDDKKLRDRPEEKPSETKGSQKKKNK